MKILVFHDEAGDHSLEQIDPNFPVFTLAGVIIKPDREKIILINTRFPSYKLSKNQLPLYTWETLICEYAKTEDIESQTVGEYIEDMNEMLRKLGIFIKTKNIKISS